ncbi:MAG: phage Gp37/Gp68 family protein [Dehalococcoidia bacterium]
MSDNSPIEWTEATWNPVTGCTKVSPGCAHCYAERLAERFRGVKGSAYEQGFDLKLWPDRLALPLRWKRPRTIFVNSMSDLFHPDVPPDFVRAVFRTMQEAAWHVFQVLTKRPEIAEQLAPDLPWPSNVWLGVSVENQRFTQRIEVLRRLPATVRFLSCEPLLGPLDLDLSNVHWVIAGGESGPGARPMRIEWAREVRDQCVVAGIPFFFKQWGAHNASGQRVGKSRSGRELDEQFWNEMPSPANLSA